MKIYSRPPEDSSIVIGTGSTQLMLDDDQLELIAALISHVRLGRGSPYKQAAYNLLCQLEEELGDSFTSDACDNVGLTVTIEDSQGNVVMRTTTTHDVVIEV